MIEGELARVQRRKQVAQTRSVEVIGALRGEAEQRSRRAIPHLGVLVRTIEERRLLGS